MENAKDIDGLRRVEGFEELAFDAHGHRSNHMDMGQFLKYLEHHKLDYAFKFLFGIDATVQQWVLNWPSVSIVLYNLLLTMC